VARDHLLPLITLAVINDVVPPVNADGFPKISSILSDGFDFLTKINEAGKLIL
jgi:hypothetical protein